MCAGHGGEEPGRVVGQRERLREILRPAGETAGLQDDALD
jgi:hypothetical protein